MSKQYLIRRLRWYYPTERFNAYLFSAVWLFVAIRYPLSKVLFLLYGLGVVIYILFQGQKYLGLKLARLLNKPLDQASSLTFFRKSQRINRSLIGLMPVVGVVQAALLGWTLGSQSIALWAFAANGFAILEHINYYHRQLSIDNTPDVKYLLRNKRLKVAHLARDLANGEL